MYCTISHMSGHVTSPSQLYSIKIKTLPPCRIKINKDFSMRLLNRGVVYFWLSLCLNTTADTLFFFYLSMYLYYGYIYLSVKYNFIYSSIRLSYQCNYLCLYLSLLFIYLSTYCFSLSSIYLPNCLSNLLLTQAWIGSDKSFTYDHVFDVGSMQQEVYEETVKQLIEGTFEGEIRDRKINWKMDE